MVTGNHKWCTGHSSGARVMTTIVMVVLVMTIEVVVSWWLVVEVIGNDNSNTDNGL